MQQFIDELNLPHYEHLQQVMRIYSFFKMQELELKVDFTFDEFYHSILTNEPNYLIQHLICCYFEKHLQDMKQLYSTLIYDKNRCIRQCLIYGEMFKIFEYLQEQHQITDNLIVPDYQFYELDAESKIQGLIMIVNYLAQHNKWLNGIIQSKLQIYPKVNNIEQYRQKWENDLIDLVDQQQKLQSEEKSILRKRQFIGVSLKKRLKEIEREMYDLEEKIKKQEQLMNIDLEALQKYCVNQMKIIHRDEQCCIWSILPMPNYILVKIGQHYNLLFGEEVNKLMAQFDALKNLDFQVIENKQRPNQGEGKLFQKIYKFDQKGFEQYLSLKGKKEYLIYCQQITNLNEIIKNIILDTEEIITEFFSKYRKMSWNYPSIRKQWRKSIQTESDTDFVYTFYNKVSLFRTRYYDFQNDDQIPEDYQEKRIPLHTHFKIPLTDLQMFKNNEYCFALLFYFKVLSQYKQQEQNVQEKQKFEDSKEKSSRKSQNSMKQFEEPAKKNRRAVIEDDDDEDDEDFDVSQYQYK